MSSSNMFKNFTSCAHTNSAKYLDSVLISVIILLALNEHISSFPPSVATRPLTLFMVYFLVVNFY